MMVPRGSKASRIRARRRFAGRDDSFVRAGAAFGISERKKSVAHSGGSELRSVLLSDFAQGGSRLPRLQLLDRSGNCSGRRAAGLTVFDGCIDDFSNCQVSDSVCVGLRKNSSQGGLQHVVSV